MGPPTFSSDFPITIFFSNLTELAILTTLSLVLQKHNIPHKLSGVLLGISAQLLVEED